MPVDVKALRKRLDYDLFWCGSTVSWSPYEGLALLDEIERKDRALTAIREEAAKCDKIQGGSLRRTYGYGFIRDEAQAALSPATPMEEMSNERK